jgi:ribonuclease III
MDHRPPCPLESVIGHTFTQTSLLDEALRHSSYVNETTEPGVRDNERLEFLGDAVLNLVVGHILLERFPDLTEGDLSRMRASLVNEQQLAGLARRLDLGPHIRLGKGEAHTGGHQKNSILAGALEALIAAVYVDAGFQRVFEFITQALRPLLDQVDNAGDHNDFKSQLQEIVQARTGAMPCYAVIREEGPDHDKTFWVRLTVLGAETQGTGKSKKAAEQDAARRALALVRPQ